MKTVFELLNHDNTISVNRRLAHALGLSEAVIYAALLAKHAWYEQHGKLSDGWFYSTVDDMEESTSLTKCQQSRCVKRLVSAGLIRCAAKGLPARRFFYIVDDPQLLEGIIGVCEPSPEENAPAVYGVGMSQEQLEKLMGTEEEPDHEAERTHTHLGVYAVRKRLDYVYQNKARMSITSEPGKGTQVILEIPMNGNVGVTYRKCDEPVNENNKKRGDER